MSATSSSQAAKLLPQEDVRIATAPLPVERHEVVVVGGGTAGITVAARLRRALHSVNLAIVEPAERHYYQPLWTLVGGGVFDKSASERTEASLIPEGAAWVREAAVELRPEENLVVTGSGRQLGYDALVVAPGIQIDWDAIPGLRAALGESVGSIWSYEHLERTWELIRDFQGGTAVFTYPVTPIKCPGAAQKIMYLADDTFRRVGIRGRTRVVYASAAPSIYSVPRYAPSLERVVERRGIETLFRHNLVAIRPESREAVLEQLDTGEQVTLPYDLLHVAPPQSAPDLVKQGPLAGPDGWLELDKNTLQHARFPNVFGLGDASSLPTSKTGAAVRAQAKVLVANLVAALAGEELPARYDGYTACPIITGYGRLILAEFDYDLQPRETFPFDQSKERRSMYLLKKRVLPRFYWSLMLRGRG